MHLSRQTEPSSPPTRIRRSLNPPKVLTESLKGRLSYLFILKKGNRFFFFFLPPNKEQPTEKGQSMHLRAQLLGIKYHPHKKTVKDRGSTH